MEKTLMPKILIAVPYHREKKYSVGWMLHAVDSLTYDNKEVIMRWDLGEYGGKDNVKKQREFFRKFAIDQGFDYLYFLGVDTIPPSDVIERLLSHKKNIVGGVYWGRHGAENGRVDGAVAWIHNMPLEEQNALFKKPELLEVDGMGMDCVLISREVLEKISYLSWPQNDDDYPFYDKAKQLGYRIYLDAAVQCRHFYDKVGSSYMGARC